MVSSTLERGSAVLVVDCGSTNLRAVLVDKSGRFVAQASRANTALTRVSARPDWYVWAYDVLWTDIRQVTRETLASADPAAVGGVIVATWGADGAPLRKDGSLAYPPIAWQCPRTKETVREVAREMTPWEIYRRTGYQMISFNTLFRLVWLRRHQPKSLLDATWLMMPGLIVHSLTGELSIEPTSASTMMAMDLARRDWSIDLLRLATVEPSFFPSWSEPSDIVGQVTEKVSRETGLNAGTPVHAGGHDTQFAAVGAGASAAEAILSSGTWEILEARVREFRPTRVGLRGGVLVEADIQPGLWDAQLLMVGSAVLEWIRRLVYPDLAEGEYEALIRDASTVQPGSSGVMVLPAFVDDSGPTRIHGTRGTILGLSLHTTRSHLYRAALEGLSHQLRHALEVLEASSRSRVEGIRVVGGGSKNPLWNQLRTDVTALPVTTPVQPEATILGAALTAFVGLGTYRSLEEAQRDVQATREIYRPGANSSLYRGFYRRYRKLPLTLRTFYVR